MKKQNTKVSNKLPEEHMKNFQEVNLSDDFLFAKVMEDPEICRKMIEILIGMPIKKIVLLQQQKTLQQESDGKGIRMDVYSRDDRKNMYNLEIQCKVDRKDIPKRARFYGSSVDMDMIHKSDSYRQMKESFIIFICTFDLYRQGRHVYTFSNRCWENTLLDMGDETTKMFFNTKGTANDVSEEVLEFLHYVEDSTDKFAEQAKTAFIKELHQRVKHVKQDRRTEEAYMTLQERDWENREEGRQEGRQEERQENLRHLISVCKSLGAKRDYIIQQIVDSYHLTTEEATEKVNMILS